MGKFAFFARSACTLLCFLLTGCADEIPKPLTEKDVEEMLGPVLIRSVPSEEMVIQSTTKFIFVFNQPVSEVKVDGKPASLDKSSTRASVEFGDLQGIVTLFVWWKWSPQGESGKQLIFVVVPVQ